MGRPCWATEILVRMLRANIKQNEVRSRLEMTPQQFSNIINGVAVSEGMVTKIIGTVNQMVAEKNQ